MLYWCILCESHKEKIQVKTEVHQEWHLILCVQVFDEPLAQMIGSISGVFRKVLVL